MRNNQYNSRRWTFMRLEIGNIFIQDIQFGAETKVENGVLYVNKEELLAEIGGDERIESIDFDIARPGESVRIIPVKDVVEPRVKVEGNGGIFPGFISKVDTVGSGRTHVLKGAAVVTTGKIVGFQEGIIDMTGEGAKYTPFSKTNNLVIKAEPKEGINQHNHEDAIRMIGFKAATYLGKAGKNVEPNEVKTFETLPILEQVKQYPDLPKVVYVYMIQTQGLLHDTYVYGVDGKKIIPTIMYPTEAFDGAVVSGNCVSACDKNPTYVHMNQPVIEELYGRHGKDINFIGCIVTNENVYLADKQRSSDWVAKTLEFLGADAAVVSEEGFGNPDADLVMNCNKITDKGIKTVLLTDEYAGQDGSSQSLADSTPKADAVVTNGNANELVILPKMDKIIGHPEAANIIAGANFESLREDGSIEAEIQVITGATSEVGFHYLTAKSF